MRRFHLLLLPFLISLSTPGFGETTLYRYVDNNGVKVISSQIPAKYVGKGYEILSLDGRLIETVPPEPNPEEKARIIKELEEQKRLAAWDKALLQRYSHPDDIEAAKQRKLSQIQGEMAIRQRTIEKINAEIDRYQSLAAASERAGQPVPEEILNKMAILRRDREAEYATIDRLEKDQINVTETFNSDIDRFKQIRSEK